MATSFGGAVNIVARPNRCVKFPLPIVELDIEKDPAVPFLCEGLNNGILDPNPPILSLPSLLLDKPAVVVEVVVFTMLIMLLSFLAMTDAVLRG